MLELKGFVSGCQRGVYICKWLSVSDRKLLSLKGREERLDLLPSGGKDEGRGGSSMPGDIPSRGEMEKAELASEMRDGAPSTDSVLDASETVGEGRGPSKFCRR